MKTDGIINIVSFFVGIVLGWFAMSAAIIYVGVTTIGMGGMAQTVIAAIVGIVILGFVGYFNLAIALGMLTTALGLIVFNLSQ